MTFDEISEKAFKSEKINEFANLAEKYAYAELKELYRDFKNDLIDKNKAVILKQEIKNEFLINERLIKEYTEIKKKQNDIRIKYETYFYEVEKSTTESDLLYNSLKFIENVIQDDTFFERNYDKINN